MKANQARYPVTTMCQTLEVSTSGYYAWCSRTPSKRAQADAELKTTVRTIWERSRESYGAPRIHEELRDEHDTRVGKKRVARLMKEADIQGVTRRKGTFTTRRDKNARPAPDLVERTFVATARDQLWVADITYVPTWSGFLYLAVVMDVWSRRIVGWSMATHLRTQIVLDALNMAVAQRRPTSVIHHSDQGSQYTSIEFGARCKQANVRPSMGRWLTATTMRCVKVSLQRWNANCSIERGSKRRRRQSWPCLISLKDGIIRTVVIRRWATNHQRSSSFR